MRKPALLVTAILAALLLGGCQSIREPAWALPPGTKTLEAHGYPIAYQERGSGPTVVLVHGALGDYRTWAPQVDALPGFRLVTLSLRHYYPEPWKGEGEFSLVRHGADVAAFIERLGAGPVHLVGWSRGGAVAVEAVKARPDLVRTLVLMDPALFSLVAKPGSAPGDDPRVKRARATEVYFRRGEMERGLEYFVDDVNGVGAWRRLPEAQRQVRRDNAWTAIGQIGDVETVSCTELGNFRMPVLLMGGEQSPPAFNRIREAAQRCMPSARTVTIPKAGHAMHQNNPTVFNAELARFLSQ